MICGIFGDKDKGDTEEGKVVKEIRLQSLAQNEVSKQKIELPTQKESTDKMIPENKNIQQDTRTSGTDSHFVTSNQQTLEHKPCEYSESKDQHTEHLNIQENVRDDQAFSENVSMHLSYTWAPSQQDTNEVALDHRELGIKSDRHLPEIDTKPPLNKDNLVEQVHNTQALDTGNHAKEENVDVQGLKKNIDESKLEVDSQHVKQANTSEKLATEKKIDDAEPCLKPKLMNLGSMNQAEYGIDRNRPPACTLYSGLFLLFALKNNKEMRSQFHKDNLQFFSKMQKEIMDQGIFLYMYAKEQGLTSVLDGRINPDELQSAFPDKFGRLYLIEKSWCSGNPLFGEEQQIQLLRLTGNVFVENTATFIVADAETFALFAVGDGKHAWYFNSHKTGLAREGGRATHFGVMNNDGLLAFLTCGMHGNQPCNSIDLFFFKIF